MDNKDSGDQSEISVSGSSTNRASNRFVDYIKSRIANETLRDEKYPLEAFYDQDFLDSMAAYYPDLNAVRIGPGALSSSSEFLEMTLKHEKSHSAMAALSVDEQNKIADFFLAFPNAVESLAPFIEILGYGDVGLNDPLVDEEKNGYKVHRPITFTSLYGEKRDANALAVIDEIIAHANMTDKPNIDLSGDPEADKLAEQILSSMRSLCSQIDIHFDSYLTKAGFTGITVDDLKNSLNQDLTKQGLPQV